MNKKVTVAFCFYKLYYYKTKNFCTPSLLWVTVLCLMDLKLCRYAITWFINYRITTIYNGDKKIASSVD